MLVTLLLKLKYAHESPGDLVKMQTVVYQVRRLQMARTCNMLYDASGKRPRPCSESGGAGLEGV